MPNPYTRVCFQSSGNARMTPFFKVLLKCEQLEYFPSIVSEVYYSYYWSPALEKIEEKLDKLSDKAKDILEAVQDCGNEISMSLIGYSYDYYPWPADSHILIVDGKNYNKLSLLT